ncbi:MAG: DNA polymerase III subunit gamma/tau [Campylobacterales bacterium]
MSNHQALAIKYRPKNFSALIGQESVRQTLVHALDKKKIAHAYLFSGLRGSGKTSTARIFAKALLCDEGPTSEPCDACENCLMANEGRHIDIIEMDAASNRKIDDIRDLIEHTKYKPSIGRFKIFIIDEVHMLTKEAFNALLKTLEEPPGFVKFILATTDPLKLPATILSRTQHFRFKKIKKSDIVHHLEHLLNLEGVGYELPALELLSRSGCGSLRDTLTLLDQAILYAKGFVDTQSVVEMLGIINPEVIEELLALVLEGERDRLLELLSTLEDGDPETLLDETINYLKERLFSHDSRFYATTIQRFLLILSEAKQLLAINADGGFVLALTFLRMVEATKLERLDEAIKKLENSIAHPQSAAASLQPTASFHQPTLPPQEETPEAKFAKLKRKIAERDEQLGRCFQEHIHFLGFDGQTLTWESRANEECRHELKKYWPIIRQLVQEIFGLQTQIVNQPSSRPSEPPQSTPNTTIPHDNEASDESASMVEEAELGNPASCLPAIGGLAKEIDAQEILEHPFVKKAIELFDPSKVKIFPRV